ncbi:MAG: M28 family peptidase [Capsulimonadaceae bacterium]
MALLSAAVLLSLTGGPSRQAAADGTLAPPAAVQPAARPAFDATRSYSMLAAQCAFGPRVPQTPAHDNCKDYILKQLTPYVDKVYVDDFPYRDDNRHKSLVLTNIFGVINPDAPRKILLLTHWDSRPTADQEPMLVDREKPIPGADDGASGTAVQLELARTFHAKRPNVGVILLFVDGEDWGPDEDHMYLGARHFASNPGIYRPVYGILLDMIGQRYLQIYREYNSEQWQPQIDNKIWKAADQLGYAANFPNAVKYQMGDDHVPLNQAGIPCVDLIDFDYPYWHTLADTPDKCSPDSLKIAGETVAKVIYDEQ